GGPPFRRTESTGRLKALGGLRIGGPNARAPRTFIGTASHLKSNAGRGSGIGSSGRGSPEGPGDRRALPAAGRCDRPGAPRGESGPRNPHREREVARRVSRDPRLRPPKREGPLHRPFAPPRGGDVRRPHGVRAAR